MIEWHTKKTAKFFLGDFNYQEKIMFTLILSIWI